MSRVRGQRMAVMETGRDCRWAGRETEELSRGLTLWRKAFQAEGTTGAKAMRQECFWVGSRKN